MSRTFLLLLGVVLIAALAGCPDPKTPKDKTPAETAGVESTATGEPADADPLAGSIFSKEQLLEIYAAEVRGDPERKATLSEHRLIDSSGNDVPLRVKAYERALKQYAEKDPEGWSAFLESLPQ